MTYVLIALPIVALVASVIFAIRSVKRGKKTRNAVATQLLAFMAVAVVTLAVPLVASATEDHATTTAETTTTTSNEGPLGWLPGSRRRNRYLRHWRRYRRCRCSSCRYRRYLRRPEGIR